MSTEKMTLEQQNLLMDNINIFYKCCAQHNIFDEDDRQTILLRLCKAMKSYTPERGAISTFMYQVIHYEQIKLWENKKDKLDTNALSFEDTYINNDSEEGTTLAEIDGEEDENFQWIEDKIAYNQILEKYKVKFPDTWEKDINVMKAIVAGRKKLDIAKECHVPYVSISPTVMRVTKYFRRAVKGMVEA